MGLDRTTRRGFALAAIGAGLIAFALWLPVPTHDADPAVTSATPQPEVVRDAPVEPPVVEPSVPKGRAEVAPEIVITPGIPAIEGEAPMIPSLALQRGELAWEKDIRAITADPQKPDAEKARALLAALATLPAEGRATAAEEAVKRVADADYAIAQPHVTSAGTYGLALEVLFADLVERPDALRLPALLAIARNPAHPYATATRDHLAHLLGTRADADPAAWEAAIRTRLAR